MSGLIPVIALLVMAIFGYTMGRKDGRKGYTELLSKFNNLQSIHNELLKTKWTIPVSEKENITDTGYWEAEKDFKD